MHHVPIFYHVCPEVTKDASVLPGHSESAELEVAIPDLWCDVPEVLYLNSECEEDHCVAVLLGDGAGLLEATQQQLHLNLMLLQSPRIQALKKSHFFICLTKEVSEDDSYLAASSYLEKDVPRVQLLLPLLLGRVQDVGVPLGVQQLQLFDLLPEHVDCDGAVSEQLNCFVSSSFHSLPPVFPRAAPVPRPPSS